MDDENMAISDSIPTRLIGRAIVLVQISVRVFLVGSKALGNWLTAPPEEMFHRWHASVPHLSQIIRSIACFCSSFGVSGLLGSVTGPNARRRQWCSAPLVTFRPRVRKNDG